MVYAGDDEFGKSVSLNAFGNIVGIEQSNHDSSKGHVRIFKWNESSVQLGSDIDGESDGDLFGIKLQLNADGKTIVIGTDGINPRYIKAYEYSSGGWTQMGF